MLGADCLITFKKIGLVKQNTQRVYFFRKVTQAFKAHSGICLLSLIQAVGKQSGGCYTDNSKEVYQHSYLCVFI